MRVILAWVRSLDDRVRAIGVFFVSALILILAFRGGGLWHEPLLIIAAALLLAAAFTCLVFERTRNWLSRMDWRIGAVLLATDVSVAATLTGFDLGLNGDAGGKFLHDVFAAWVGAIAFFGIVGLVVTVVSLARPEEERFENRARILFRGQDGRHIEYIVKRISETFEQYAEHVTDVITIRDFDQTSGRFLVNAEATTILRNYIDDVQSKFESRIRMQDVADPPPGRQPNRLTFLDVGGASTGSRVFRDGRLAVPIETIIPKRGSCRVAYGMEYWVQAGTEPNTYAPVRYTLYVGLTIRNHIPDGLPVHIRLTKDGGGTFDDHHLRPGEERLICEARDLEPATEAYDFRILPLTGA